MALRLLWAVAVGVASYFALNALSYFPEWWIPGFAFAVAILAVFQLHAAILLALFAFAVPVAYHSYGLMILMGVFLIALGCVVKFIESPELFLVIVLTPVFAAWRVAGYSLPLEFIALFLIAALAYGKKIPLLAALACLWCLSAGIVAKEPLMGNLVIGPKIHSFFTLKPAALNFYDLGWLYAGADLSATKQVATVFSKWLKVVLGRPVILVQAAGWAAASYVLFYFLELRNRKNQWWLHAAGLAAAGALLLVLQIAVVALSPHAEGFPVLRFAASLAASSVVFFAGWEWRFYLQNRNLAQRIQPSAAAVETLRQREVTRRKDLTLDETLRMQADLQAYIQKKFVREVTALDIDIAESTRLKEGASPEEVIKCFAEYWKLVDLAALTKTGRLLNRAGDGAIYLFGQAEHALQCALDIRQKLKDFNQKANTLKAPFAVRMGLNTGEILEDPTKKTADVFSQVLDVAGHLQKMASPGEILVSESAYRELLSKHDFEARASTGKGLGQVFAYRG
jgi:class 3 adenylate cyclase